MCAEIFLYQKFTKSFRPCLFIETFLADLMLNDYASLNDMQAIQQEEQVQKQTQTSTRQSNFKPRVWYRDFDVQPTRTSHRKNYTYAEMQIAKNITTKSEAHIIHWR